MAATATSPASRAPGPANAYDGDGNLTSIQNTGPGGVAIDAFSYTYDAAGNVVSETDTQNGVSKTTAYSYDPAGQLLSTSDASYSYDANGNRNSTGDSVGPDNQLLSYGTYNYTYDAQGNEITQTNIATGFKWTYGYNNANEMTSAVETSADGTVELSAAYKYDVFGNRVEKDVTAGGVTTVQRYAYDGWNPAKPSAVGLEDFDIWADLDGESSLTTRNISGDAVDQHFAFIDAGSSAATSWYLTDHLGSTRDLVNNSGTVQDSIAYGAFGNITSETNAANRGQYAWTGREIDVETGLQYNRARYYDASTGRWISQDPMGFDAGDSNLYRYVSNQPTDATDPSGKHLFALGEASVRNAQSFLKEAGVPTQLNAVNLKDLEGIPPSISRHLPPGAIGPNLFLLVPDGTLARPKTTLKTGSIQEKLFNALDDWQNVNTIIYSRQVTQKPNKLVPDGKMIVPWVVEDFSLKSLTWYDRIKIYEFDRINYGTGENGDIPGLEEKIFTANQ